MSAEERLRHKLDNWRLWVGVAYFGLAAVVVALFFLNRAQAHDEARHAAEIASSAQSQYVQCIASIPLVTKINGFIEGSRIIDETLIANSRANLAITVRSDPTYRTKLANLQRLERAASAASEVEFPVPTPADCKARLDKLLQSD